MHLTTPVSNQEWTIFHDKLGDDLSCPMKAFKAPRLFSPSEMNEMHPTTANIADLEVFPFLVGDTCQQYLWLAIGWRYLWLVGDICGLQDELPTCCAKAAVV